MDMTTSLVLRKPSELIPYSGTARRHSAAQIEALRRCILDVGFLTPILIDKNNVVIDGHAQLEAAIAAEMSQVPCVPVEFLSDTQIRAYRLACHKIAEMTTWDAEALRAEMLMLQNCSIDLQLLGFSPAELRLIDPADVREDDFCPVLPAEPTARRGQIWQLGRHRLICGDASCLADLQRLMDGSNAQLLLTDPPYNVDVTGGSSAALKIAGDNLPETEFAEMLRRAIGNAASVLEPGSSFYIWHPDGEPGRIFRDVLHELSLRVRQTLVWVKQSSVLGRQDYHWRHEPCLHGQTEPEQDPALDPGETWDAHECCLYGWTDGRRHLWCADRKQTTVLEFDRPMKSAEHPTMKPVKLMAYEIANSTLLGAAVLDPFGGSGSTLIACEQLGRTAYLMEIDPRYCDVIIDRWQKMTGKTAVLLKDGAV